MPLRSPRRGPMESAVTVTHGPNEPGRPCPISLRNSCEKLFPVCSIDRTSIPLGSSVRPQQRPCSRRNSDCTKLDPIWVAPWSTAENSGSFSSSFPNSRCGTGPSALAVGARPSAQAVAADHQTPTDSSACSGPHPRDPKAGLGPAEATMRRSHKL